MRIVIRPIVLVLLLVAIGGCGSPSQVPGGTEASQASTAVAPEASKELTRAKALELLKAGSADLLSDAVWDGALYWWRFGTDGPSPDDCRSLKQLAFSERLGTMGTVKRSVLVTPPFRSPYENPRPGMTDYAFRVVDRTFAKGRAGGQPDGETIDLVMGKAALGEITGIKEGGTSAVAEASIHFEPTPIFQALADTEAAFAQKGQRCDPLYQLPGAQTKSFRFERYDDGWRLKGKAE